MGDPDLRNRDLGIAMPLFVAEPGIEVGGAFHEVWDTIR